MYQPDSAMPDPKSAGFKVWLLDEFRRIALEVGFPDLPSIRLQEIHAAPSKTYEGLTVLADGTDWNPGSGQGVYTFYGAAWHKLG